MRALALALLLLPGAARAGVPLATPTLTFLPAEEYELRRVTFRLERDPVFLPAGDTVFVGEEGSWAPYLGDRAIDGPDFYDVVDQPDIARSLRTRRTVGLALAVAGTASMIGGVALGFHGDSIECSTADCNDGAQRLVVAGVGLAAGGLLAVITGGFLGTDTHRSERPAMARAHNRRLREKLHLPEPAQDDLFGAVVPVPGGAMLALGLRGG